MAAQAFVIVGASWLGALIWFWLLRQGDASRVSAYFFLNPVLGVFFGAVLLGEPLGVADFGVAAVVALGIYVVQRAPERRAHMAAWAHAPLRQALSPFAVIRAHDTGGEGIACEHVVHLALRAASVVPDAG